MKWGIEILWNQNSIAYSSNLASIFSFDLMAFNKRIYFQRLLQHLKAYFKG